MQWPCHPVKSAGLNLGSFPASGSDGDPLQVRTDVDEVMELAEPRRSPAAPGAHFPREEGPPISFVGPYMGHFLFFL